MPTSVPGRQCKVGVGVAIYFICKDALAVYREVTGRGLEAADLAKKTDTGLAWFASQTDRRSGSFYQDAGWLTQNHLTVVDLVLHPGWPTWTTR